MGDDRNNGATPPALPEVTDVERFGGTLPDFGLKRLRSGALTSIDATSQAGRKLLYDALMGDAGKADDYLNQILQVTDIVITPAESTDPETGHLDRWARTVLILAGGERVAFGSKGILKSLSLYCDCFSPPPWNPPAEFVLKSQPIGKNRWYTLAAAEIAPPAPKLKKA